MNDINITRVKLKDLVFPDYNPRNISERELTQLKNSIDEFGYIEPIIVNEYNNHIVGGNQRARALTELGYTEVDVLYVYITDMVKEKACNIALNKISGEWNEELLKEILEEIELSDFDIELTGFTDIELQEFDIINRDDEEVESVEDNFELESEIEIYVSAGELWELGNHRLYCGDSSNNEDIDYLIGNNDINMILTDPPYGMGLDTDFSGMANYANTEFNSRVNPPKSTRYKNRKIDDFNKQFIDNIFNLKIKETFLFGANYYTQYLQDINKGSWLVWDKRANEDYTLEQSKKADKGFGSCFELIWSKTPHKQDIIRIRWFGVFGTEKEFDKKRSHPTQKPVELNAWFLTKYSDSQDNILDLFGGSGSTLLACEQTNRNCYMMEIDPYYCQIIINRWEQFTGEKARRIK